jgi:hypothetical protein
MSCVAPGCRSGYGTSGKLPPGVRLHVFPKDLKRRDLWTKSIHRASWKPAKKSVICSLHFSEDDYHNERVDTNIHRKVKQGQFKYRRLKESAVPHIFPGLPGYLSKVKTQPRQQTSLSTSRARNELSRHEQEVDKFLSADKVESFEELMKNIKTDFPPSWNVVSLFKDRQIFLEEVTFGDDEKPSLWYSITITENLQFQLVSNNIILPSQKAGHITKSGKIERSSDVKNLMAFLRSYSDTQVFCFIKSNFVIVAIGQIKTYHYRAI